ncbi:MAG: DUF4019 domain-containing protein [Desulfuromonadaceae bacterium]|nr:DUF4019 domain-containing protein [Desulfuromonadaceae bacterium]
MKSITAIKLSVTFLLFFMLPFTSYADQSRKVAAATSAAENFLQLVDAGRYPESWDVTSEYFKTQISKEQWVKQLENFIPTLGNLLNREIEDTEYTKSLSNAPEGEYVVIQFSTSFEHKNNALETVTPMLESDGEWRVTGYYIR